MLIAVASVEQSLLADTGASIVLEARRGEETIAITVRYAAIVELRGLVKAADVTASGVLLGRCGKDAATIDHCSTAVKAQRAIGAFRTQPGGWPLLTEADLKAIQSSVEKPAGHALFLIVRTLAQRPWSATLFAVNPKEPSTAEAPLLEFPFDEYLLRNGWLTDLAPPPIPQPRVVARPARRRRAPWIALAAAAALIGGGAVAYQLRWRQPASPAETVEAPDPAAPAPSALSLKVGRSLDEFEVSWNRNAEAVQTATAGTLTIHNGPVARTIPVSANQLREGRIMYHPLSGVDAEFRLELLLPDGRALAESMQVVGFDTAPSFTLPVPAAPPDKAPARPSLPRQSRQQADRADTAGVTRQGVTLTGRTEPVPTRRVSPNLTREVLEERRNATGPVTMSVLISIDATGTVRSAKVVSSTGEPVPSGSQMRLASLNAARQWKFRPATVAGKATPAELTLVFHF